MQVVGPYQGNYITRLGPGVCKIGVRFTSQT
jgi:hypothetical protein